MTEKVTFGGGNANDSQAGQPAVSDVKGTETPQTPAGTPAGTPETGLSEGAIRKIIAQEMAGALETARRSAQSYAAQAEKRVRDQVTQQLATLKAAGLPAGPQEAKALETVIRSQTDNQSGTIPEEPAAQPEPGESASATGDDANTRAYAIMDALGVDIDTEDPEAKLLDHSSPDAYVASVRKAVLAKITRQSTQPEARMPVGGEGGPAGRDPNLTGRQILESYYKRHRT